MREQLHFIHCSILGSILISNGVHWFTSFLIYYNIKIKDKHLYQSISFLINCLNDYSVSENFMKAKLVYGQEATLCSLRWGTNLGRIGWQIYRDTCESSRHYPLVTLRSLHKHFVLVCFSFVVVGPSSESLSTYLYTEQSWLLTLDFCHSAPMILTLCVCVFQVRGMPAAAPRASGCTSVIPPFRRYRSQGYSTLRHTCSSTRKCCNVTSELIFPEISQRSLFCFVLFLVHACTAPLTVSVSGWREEKGKTSLYTHLSYIERKNPHFWIS